MTNSTPGDPRAAGHSRPARAATVMESVEDLRAQVLQARRGVTEREVRPDLPASKSAPSDDAEPFRPVARPPIAMLRALDDGETEGQDVRIRATPFVIGRTEGDLIIPHDGGISGRHAELSRVVDQGVYRWFLRDLQSTNGTFVRVSNSPLKDGQEMLVGGLRLRFSLASPAAPTEAESSRPASTQKWHVPAPGHAGASGAELVVLTPGGDGPRHAIGGVEGRIGRDPSRCGVVLDDPMVSPVHARIVRDPQGRWTIHNERSLNGLWLRVPEIPLGRGGQFQCGEQRFLVRIP